MDTQVFSQKDNSANPAPLGLMGFGMTTVLLNIHNAGGFALGSVILAMGIFYGGLAQIIAGIMEWKKGNTFGTTAFTSCGFFWLSFVGFIVLPKMGVVNEPEGSAVVAYLFMWGIFTFILFIGTLKLSRSLQVIFGTLVILFFLLAIGDLTGISVIKRIAGFEGILCGLSAIYAAAAQVINEIYGKEILPL